MKKLQYIGCAFMFSMALVSCSEDFMDELQNYDAVDRNNAYNNYDGAKGRLSDAVVNCMPDVNSNPSWKNTSTGSADDHSQSTEEYCGFSKFVDPQKEMTYMSGTNAVPDYFQNQANNIKESVWGRIRNLNDIIEGVQEGTLSEAEKNEILGQTYFFRAWCYYNLMKWYGGVPLVKEVQIPAAGIFTPRSTTKETMEFIIEDLEKSAELLAPFTTNGGWARAEDYGRVTSGTALALKGRVLLLWASPLFNRANDKTRWQTAYSEMKKDLEIINSCGYGLRNETAPGINASGWAEMFNADNNEEAVFVTLYNKIKDGGTPDYSRNNPWERGIRPSNTLGNGGKEPSAAMVDLFPMSDGKRPAQYNSYTTVKPSDIAYDPTKPFLNRDPRFYRTFAFSGVRWAFEGDPNTSATYNPYVGSNYELWSYVWYNTADDRNNVEQSGKTYGTDNLLDKARGMYIRKRSNDADVSKARYDYSIDAGFKYNACPFIELRYAEVLLNFAEAAAGAGEMGEAVAQLKRIRQRVGYTGDCGLDATLTSDQAACLAAVLYERQIELAYEGKRFDDMRRWMLFDGGTEKVDGAPASWNLTGWGGNTCTYLGFKPLNNQRRERIEFRVRDTYNKGLGGDKFEEKNGKIINPDPLADATKTYPNQYDGIRPAAVDLSKELEPQLTALTTFYDTYIERIDKTGDGRDSDKALLYIKYLPKYYFLGLGQGALSNNIGIQQTIGWGDYNNGGANGTFDPLAE